MNFEGKTYEVIDELDNIPIVDSFVKFNKIGRGSGEARLYVGAQTKMDFKKFFEHFQDRGVFLKKDLRQYLDDAKFEYEQQEQEYQRDISSDWPAYSATLSGLADEEFFEFEEAADQARYYIRARNRSNADIFYGLFRSIMLPNISYVSILKLASSSGDRLFLFKPYLSYSFNPYYHPAKEREEEKKIATQKIPATKKTQLIEARVGQGKYRDDLLNESSECIVTRVNDERLLIASHIKPWSVSTDPERLDHNNGLALTPTYDKLFDQGFISFSDDGKIMISNYISPLNIKKLGIPIGKTFTIPASPTRRQYLDYHRKNIFKS